MDLSRQEYPMLLAALQPDQAVNVLNDRVSLINSVNASIADFLQERRRIEERYAADLRKLSKRPQQDAAAALGVFHMPWQRIVSGTESLAQSHETLASKIETDVELPLKQYASKNREMQGISTVQGNLASIAKDVTRARERAEKSNARGSRKAGDVTSGVEDASREWESQAPFVFEQLQTLDEHRVNHLRDVLTQFQTHEADQVERNRASAESCLNALLNIETADEIKTFAARVQQGRGVSSGRQSYPMNEQRPSSSGIVPPTPPPPRNQDPRLRSTSNEDSLAPLPEPTPQKSKMGGLKRLGTVMSRRKSAIPPPPQATYEKKKEKSRPFASFRRGDSSRSFQDLETTGQDLTPVTSHTERTGSRQGLAALEISPQTSDTREAVNGTGFNGLHGQHLSPSDELPQPLMPSVAQPAQPNAQEVSSAPSMQASTTGPVSSDLFAPAPNDVSQTNYELEDSSRNLTIRDQPIQEDAGEAQLAMNNMANRLRMEAQSRSMTRPQGSVRGRRDVRNTVFIPGIQENPAMAPASDSGLSPPASPMPTIYDAPSAPSVPSAPSALSSSLYADVVTLPQRASTSGTILEDHLAGSDVNSIHSAQSLTTMVHHPEMHEQGLNASIIETVSTWFSETGVTKSVVVGEVAFAHVTSPMSTHTEHEVVRLQNFQALEKVAANPTFITPFKGASGNLGNSEEQAGSYTVALTAIRRAAPTVAFKYQLHLNEANMTQYSPIMITPAWQIVEGQTSVIVLYSLNPAFAAGSSVPTGEITLKNVAISVNLDIKDTGAAKPTSAMMAPTQGASFRRKAGTVIWRLPELRVKSDQERLLVRFVTEEGMAKRGSIDVKFEMPGVTAGGLGIEQMSGATSAPEVDPFADEEERKSAEHGNSGAVGWTTLPTKKMLMSGKYSAV